MTRHLARFATVGALNTVLCLVVYLVLRTFLPATGANVLATVLTTITGTNANGRVTFRVEGAIGLRPHLKSMVLTALGLAITTSAVAAVDTDALGELAVLVAASGVAGLVRFALMRTWVFGSGTDASASTTSTGVGSTCRRHQPASRSGVMASASHVPAAPGLVARYSAV